MDSHHHFAEKSQENAAPEEHTNQLAVVPAAPPPFATASLSLFAAVQPATHFFQQPKVASLFAAAQPAKARVPTQASSLAHLSLSASAVSPPKISFKSTISANPLQSPLDPSGAAGLRRASVVWFRSDLRVHDNECLNAALPAKARVPTQASSLAHLSQSASAVSPPKIFSKSNIFAYPLPSPLEPYRADGLRRISVVWFRSDLRVHDNECLNAAHNESMSVLNVYCFDPRDYGKSKLRFDKTGPYRASFLLESVSDLRRSLRDRGSDLVVRVGRPEEVLTEMAKAVGAEAVYAHREVSGDKVKSEERIEAAMKEEGVEVKYFWGSTLFHVDDLPFKVEDLPTKYGDFRERAQGLEVRKTIAALDQLKGLPKRGDVEPGEMPSLTDLGVNPGASMAQDGEMPSIVGGETEALQRLKKFAAECQAQPNKGTNNDNIYRASFHCEIWPWLICGCISPRAMFEELKKTASNVISAASKNYDGGSSSTGSNRLMYELLCRDFMRFVVKKFSSPVKQGGSGWHWFPCWHRDSVWMLT